MNKATWIAVASIVLLAVPVSAGDVCDDVLQSTEFARWDFNGCDPSGPAGSEDCGTNGPVLVMGDAGCLSAAATEPCNGRQDFSCQTGVTGEAVCFPVSSSSVYFEGSSFAIHFSISLSPDPTQEAQFTRLEFQMADISNDQLKYALIVRVDDVVIFSQEDILVPENWTLQSFDFSADPDFTVSAATTFEVEILGYCGSGAIEFDDMVAFGGCCNEPVSVDPTSWSSVKGHYND